MRTSRCGSSEATSVAHFWPKVRKTDGCWIWLANKGPDGYGYYISRLNGKQFCKAHRFAYELLVGPIAEGMTIDHLCRNRICVNPAHLEVVTLRENILRGEATGAVNARKTHCNNGHPLSGSNLGLEGKLRTFRRCRACNADKSRRWRQAQCTGN